MKFDIKCKHCKRFLATTNKSTVIDLKCSNSSCKKLETYKITFMSDLILKGHSHPQPEDNSEEIAMMQEKLAELDGRTKEAKDLKAELENVQAYATQLEGIIDGQG
jgi:phage FluMu protein Com